MKRRTRKVCVLDLQTHDMARTLQDGEAFALGFDVCTLTVAGRF
jgi:hypothetical protein